MSLEVKTRLVCDICGDAVVWESPVSKTAARTVGRTRGWRVDKLNRDVCAKHPPLVRQKKITKEK